MREIQEQELNDLVEYARKYPHHIHWGDLLAKTILPEYFIREFWYHITPYAPILSRCQNLSEEFMMQDEFCKYLNWPKIASNQKLSEKVIEKNIIYFDVDTLIIYQNLSPEFIKKYKIFDETTSTHSFTGDFDDRHCSKCGLQDYSVCHIKCDEEIMQKVLG